MTVLTWSEDRVEQLKKLWEAGLSASQIAAELGNVTRNAVIGKLARLDHCAFGYVAEQPELAPFSLRDRTIGTAQQDVRLDADRQ